MCRLETNTITNYITSSQTDFLLGFNSRLLSRKKSLLFSFTLLVCTIEIDETLKMLKKEENLLQAPFLVVVHN